jgi:hypothetical protein
VAGTIAVPPETAQQLVADQAPWYGLTRRFNGAHRMITFYWVWFDEPQNDPDGDVPYKGEIDADAIEPLNQEQAVSANCVSPFGESRHAAFVPIRSHEPLGRKS